MRLLRMHALLRMYALTWNVCAKVGRSMLVRIDNRTPFLWSLAEQEVRAAATQLLSLIHI